jgi:putative transposase
LGIGEKAKKTSRFTEQQISLRASVSQQTYSRWRKKHGGLTPSEVKRLKRQEEENRRLKTMAADLSLDKATLQDVLSKKL